MEMAENIDIEGGLHYVRDDMPGYRRIRRGRGFSFLGPDGKPVRKPEVIERLRNLVIPPAWEEVWISPNPQGHIQATGRDARGRKQYIYHPRWNEIRSESKFDRVAPFAQVLPRIRERVDLDLRRPPFSRQTALAFVVTLLDKTHLRVGHPKYARQNNSYGVTTLLDYHVEVIGTHLLMKFRGKSGQIQEVNIRHRKLARIARQYQELPGQELIQYQNGSGEFQTVDSGEVNEYLREITGDDFTAKDFRTWGGSVCAASELHRLGPSDTRKGAKAKIVGAIRRTAYKLGNTPAVCRKYYVHPRVIEAYLDGTLSLIMAESDTDADGNCSGLSNEEAAVLKLLE
ncbi:MAG: DNA topoisomerase IB [Desulfobacteraceae bacterium]|nr:MAG: DNA topoisomerase IB [Desulfobacteraceae bacterium]